MPETLQKLRPDRDLQCYFERPSAIAALSAASASRFTISGTWRQQLDWAVLEWNRDNVFEHPAYRNLPDGDLSGLELTYEETRTNCIPIDSSLYPTVDWPHLRVWVEGVADPYRVPLLPHATPIEGSYVPASFEMELTGTLTAGDYIGLSWLAEQYNTEIVATDTLASAAARLAGIVNTFSTTVSATAIGASLLLTAEEPGANFNRTGVYGFVSHARTEAWTPWWGYFAGGASPTKWRVALDFGDLHDTSAALVPTTNVRKMRWTYSAEFQRGAFARSEFAVAVTNWSVSGTGREYLVAGPGSRRLEDDAGSVHYVGAWTEAKGNFSGGTIRYATEAGAEVSCTYRASAAHQLLLGTRKAPTGAQISVAIDGGAGVNYDLSIPGEDVLVRIPIGERGTGTHEVVVTLLGPNGNVFYFDFLELAVPCADLPEPPVEAKVSLAGDWDTDHSICLAPERTAWIIRSLGFHGRVNQYVGALWFYELVRAGHQYAAATVEFIGTPQFGYGMISEIRIGRASDPLDLTVLTHLHRIGDTAETVAKAFELEINRGYTAIRASAQGTVLTIYSRAMGVAGNDLTLAATPLSGTYYLQPSGASFAGGNDGDWRTDLAAVPRVNRAARDWHRSFFAALHAYGLDGTAALSLELQHGDPSPEAGIAQRCPAGDAVWLLTPALQTNFSPASVAFWRQAYRDLADLMDDAGLVPYLQFGEVQWWYFEDNRSGMPFYDEYTKAEFLAQYGRQIGVITQHTAPVSQFPDEAVFLPTLIGEFTSQVIAFVRQTHPACRFEVLYPLDVNESELNTAINFPAGAWTPAILDCLKTEGFGYTYGRNLDKASEAIRRPFLSGFPPSKSAHLVGISDARSPWQKQVNLARAQALESVVLFALDQFCLIGYPVPLPRGHRRSVQLG